MTLALAAATTHSTWLVQLLLLQQQLPAPHAIVPQAATLSGWLHHALLCRRQPATQTCGGANVVAAGYCRDCRILQPHPNLLSPSSTSISLQQTQQAVRCLGHVANLPGSTMQASHTHSTAATVFHVQSTATRSGTVPKISQQRKAASTPTQQLAAQPQGPYTMRSNHRSTCFCCCCCCKPFVSSY